MMHYQCPGCQTISTASDSEAGSIAACPHCGQKLRIPAPPTAIRTTPAEPDPREIISAVEQEEIQQTPLPRRQRRHDSEEGFDSEDALPSQRNEPSIQPIDFLVPTNVSRWSIAACYFGLIGFCLPVIGLIFAIPALIFGIVALYKRSKTVSYGSVTSDVRAILGIVLSSLAILVWTIFLIFIIVSANRR